MKICSSFDTLNKKSFKAAVGAKQADSMKQIFLPEAMGQIAKRIGYYAATPAEQKLFTVATGLIFVPKIDTLLAREDKKTDASIKSVSKCIAGGITGVGIRAFCIHIAQKYIKLNADNILALRFLPKDAKISMEINAKKNAQNVYESLNKYCNFFGTLSAILIMAFITNEHVDVPLTNDLQDFITGMVKENKTWQRSLTDTVMKRKAKITAFFERKKNKLKSAGRKIIKIAGIIKTPDKEIQQKTGGKK